LHTKKRRLTILSIFVVIIIIGSLLLPKLSNRILIEKYLADNGWHVISLSKSNRDAVVLKADYLAEDYNQMKLTASKKLGIDKHDYIDMKVDQYICILEERGMDNQLIAEIWVNNGRVICSALTQTEPNYRIKYWPVDMSLNDIREEIKQLKFPT
jgi:hypothetical protein